MARFSLLGTIVVALMMVGLHRSDAALIYYTAGLPSTASAGGVDTMNFGNIQSPPNGSYTFGSISGNSFGIVVDAMGMFADNNNDIQWASGPSIGGATFLSGGNILKFSSGASINSASASQWAGGNPGFAEDGFAGNWNAGGHGYAGLRLWAAGGSDYYYGWVELNYNAAADSVTVSSFAFESVLNAAALIPGSSSVPEPSQVAASLLLISGVAGYVFVKRRHKKLPLSKAA